MDAITFSRWCGPAALASALGISRVEAAEKILEVQPWAGPSCTIGSLGLAARRPRVLVSPRSCSESGGGGKRSTGLNALPTLAQWIKEHQTGSYMVRASHHFYHIKDGRIVEDNRMRKMRARVTHYVPMDKED